MLCFPHFLTRVEEVADVDTTHVVIGVVTAVMMDQRLVRLSHREDLTVVNKAEVDETITTTIVTLANLDREATSTKVCVRRCDLCFTQPEKEKQK